MDLLKLFTREEPIIGVEISDAGLRLAFLKDVKAVKAKEAAGEEKGKRKKKIKEERMEVAVLSEKLLPDGVIAAGRIKDKNIFVQALKDLIKQAKTEIRYAVISIPPDHIYSRLYSFPKVLSGGKMRETMRTAIEFQLPTTPANFYVDWQEEEEKEKRLAFLAAGGKEIVNDYINAVADAGLRPVAVEFHPLSIVRAVALPSGKAVFIAAPSKSGISVFVVENKIITFHRFLPAGFFADKKSFSRESRKIIDFYEAENKKSVSGALIIGAMPPETEINLPVPVAAAKISKPFSEQAEAKKDGDKWLIALGAAYRGIIPRAEDALVSLMPVGTEEAYENQRAIAFTEFIANAAVGLAIFFVAAFFASWVLMISIGNNFNNRINTLNAASLPPDTVELEGRVAGVNALIGKTSAFLAAMPAWSPLLEELKSRTVAGVLIGSLSLPSSDSAMTMTGTAINRNRLNLFKKSLEESSWLEAVAMPLTNLAQKENIPFSVSFRLKNPDSLTIDN